MLDGTIIRGHKSQKFSLALILCFLIGMYSSAVQADVLAKWSLEKVGTNYISFKALTTGDSFNCMRVKSELKITKQVAESLRQELHGFDLKPVPAIRGWQFNFITDRMCSAMVYAHEKNFEYFWHCGSAEATELEELLVISHHELDKK